MTNTARVTERLVLLPLTERSAWLVGEDGFVEGPMPLVGLAYIQIELSYPVEMKTEQRLWTDRTGRTRTRTFTTLDRTSPGVPDDALSGADMDYAVRYGLVLPPDAGDWAAEGSLLVKMAVHPSPSPSTCIGRRPMGWREGESSETLATPEYPGDRTMISTQLCSPGFASYITMA